MFDNLPYIPPPDYTMRYKPQTRHVGSKYQPRPAEPKYQQKPAEPKYQPRPAEPKYQQKPAEPKYQPKDDHGKPHHYTPEIRRSPPKTRPISTSIDDEPYEEPRNRSPEEVQRRVLRMLKEQGVPVFPTASLKQVVEHGNPSNLGPTRAYIKHLENHQKYDTLNSFRSCDNCALCKQMQREIKILEHGLPQKRKSHHHQPFPAQPYQPDPDYNDDYPTTNHRESKSEIISGRLFEPLHEVEELPEEPNELADIVVERNTRINGMTGEHARGRHNLSAETQTSQSTGSPPAHRRRVIHVPEARARRDYRAETAQQLSVQSGEKLKVIQTDAIWSLCTTRRGEMGWVPTNNLQFQHSSSLESNPGSP